MCHVLNAMLLQKLPSLFPWKHNKTKMMAEPVMEEGYIAEEDLRPCKICGRTFLPAPLVKHTKICEKNATKKRKIFNSLRQRVEGTDLALFHQKTYLKKNREHSPIHSAPAQPVSPVASVPATNVSKPAVLEAPQPPVKEMPVVESIQANKSVESLKPVSSMTGIRKTRSNALMANSTFERCPGCDRQFGPKAYDRHVEWCKEKMSRLPASNINNNQIAKERLEMRTKYRVPPINRNRKTVKEKYQMSSSASPNSAAPPSPSVPNVNSMTNLNRKPNLQRTPSVRQAPTGSTSNLNSPFTNPSDAGRNQGNRRKSEPLKACSTKNKITTTITSNINNDIPNKPNTPDTYNPFATAERQLMELLECDDFKQLNNNKLKVSPIKDKNQLNLTTPNPKLISPTPIKPLGSSTPKQKKRKSVIDPPLDFKDIGHNPQDDIDFEMLENFINDNFGNDELMRKLDLDTISLASCSTKTDNTVSFYDDISIDPRLINDFDNLSIPDNLHTETTTTPDMLRQFPLVHSNRFRLEPLEHQTARNRTTSISSDSSFADLTTAPQYSVQENKKKTNLRRSLLPDPVKPVKNLRSREDVQRYFDGNDSSSPRDHSDTKNDNRECNMVASGGNDELFTVDDEMYEEYKKYEEMYLMEKEEQLRREAEMRANEDSSNHMISADSAYGSLNRSGKTKVRSKITKLSPMEPARVDSASSSGSETCIMQNAPEHSSPINANTMANYSNNAGPGNNNSKLSKFCHECGNRYPLTTAKFCVECGVRRLPDIDKVIKNEDDEHNE